MQVSKIAGCLITMSALAVLGAGCSCHSTGAGGIGSGDHKLDYGASLPPGALPDPLGAHVRRFQAAQRENAIEQEYAIFLHEWYMGGTTLGPYGEHHLRQIAMRLHKVPYPVLVQPTHDPDINAYRRTLVVARLLEAGIIDAEARVILRNPAAEGLFGDEAPKIFSKMLSGASNTGTGFGLPGTYFPGTIGGGGGYGGFGGFPAGGGFGMPVGY